MKLSLYWLLDKVIVFTSEGAGVKKKEKRNEDSEKTENMELVVSCG